MSNGPMKDHDNSDDICHHLVAACPLGFSAPSVVGVGMIVHECVVGLNECFSLECLAIAG